MIIAKTVYPERFIIHGYRSPSSGHIIVEVSGESPVHSYILDDEGLEDFLAGKDMTSYGGRDNRRDYRFDFRMHPGRRFYLVVFNPQKTTAAVAYRVTSTE